MGIINAALSRPVGSRPRESVGSLRRQAQRLGIDDHAIMSQPDGLVNLRAAIAEAIAAPPESVEESVEEIVEEQAAEEAEQLTIMRRIFGRRD